MGLALSLLCVLTLSSQSTKAQSTEGENQLKAQEYYYAGISAKNRGEKDSAFALLSYAYRLWSSNADLAYALGELYGQRGNYERALELFRQAYESDPKRRDFFEALVSTYSWGKNQAEAKALLERWLKENPDDEEVTQYLARTHLNAGDFDKAIELYSRLQGQEQSFPRFARLAEIKATLYEAANQKDKAERELQALIQRFPDELDGKVSLIEWYYKQDQFPKALPLLESLAQAAYEAQALRALQIQYYSGIKDFAKAESLLRALAEDAQASAEDKAMRWYQFLIQSKQGDELPTQYNPVFKRLIELHPDEPAVRHTYAQVLRLQRQYAEAIEAVRPLSRITPEDQEVWNSLIGDAISLEDNEQILAFCLEAIKYIKEDWRYYFYASIGLFTKGDSKQAIAILRQGLEALPEGQDEGRAHLYAQLGDLYAEIGNRRESFANYELALKHQPDNSGVLNNYAYALAERGEELDKADQMAARAVKLDGDNINALDTYAWICFQRGNYMLAHLYQSKALDRAEQEQEVSGILLEHMGDILNAQGDLEGARSHWDRALAKYAEEAKSSPSEEGKNKAQSRLKALKKRREQSTKTK